MNRAATAPSSLTKTRGAMTPEKAIALCMSRANQIDLAIIAESAATKRGKGFGIHRAFDTSGAILGSIIALVLS